MKNFKNFNDVVQYGYKNELTRLDFHEADRHLILDAVKAKSNLITNVMAVSDERLELSKLVETEVDGVLVQKLTTIQVNNVNSGKRIIVQGGERDFTEINGKSIFTLKIEDKATDIIESRIITDLLGSSTKFNDMANATIIDKILKCKEFFGDKEFVIALGLKDYISLAEKVKVLPIKILYVPKLNNEVIGFIPQDFYINIVAGSVDFHKNIMTGVHTVAMSLLVLESYTDANSIISF